MRVLLGIRGKELYIHGGTDWARTRSYQAMIASNNNMPVVLEATIDFSDGPPSLVLGDEARQIIYNALDIEPPTTP